MTIFRQIFLATAILSAGSIYAGNNVQQTSRGIIVSPSGGKNYSTVRIEVMGDKLIHVSATPDNKFSDTGSLVVLPSLPKVPFTVSEKNDSVMVKTSKVITAVSLKTGAVRFKDLNDMTILSEDPAGRSFSPIEVEGTKGYSVMQKFLPAGKDEAYYGLGQHQSDEFNYKGKNETLFQYNTKVSVPFAVSNKGYGILWDSYSLCRFGNPADYSQLGDIFRLYDKNGKRGALTGTYIPEDKSASSLVRREDSIYFEHNDRADLKRVVNLPADFPLAGSSVVYEGDIEAKESGIHDFILYYAGYTKVYVDGELVVPERWRAAWNPNSFKFSVNLKKGKRVPLKIEWIPDGTISYCSLRAMAPRSNEEREKMIWWSEMQPQMDYYFIAGDNMDEIISGYRTLTGKSPVMPKWAMGFWQSRERYNTQDELLGTLKEFRDRKIPIDNIVLDWFYWPEDSWGSHEFDSNRFPAPKVMLDSVHKMNSRLMISVWPKFYAGTEHFKEFDKNGWMYRQAVKDEIRDWVGPGYVGSFYDAYHPEARQLFWNQMYEHLYPLGIDAWWMDASEPNVADCTDLQYRKDLCGPTALGPSAQYFNTYALMNAKAIYEGQRSVDENRRVFLLTRSGFAGLQRYSTATWSGDIGTRWEDMKAQISAGLNFAVSGIPYWTMDIGGFSVENRYMGAQHNYNSTGEENEDYKEWRELNTRWYQFGAFCPLYRSHGQFPYREAWNIAPEGHPAYNSITYYTKLRYRLMPYIYSLAGMTYHSDYTIMRPLIMDFTNDVKVNEVSDQYMFGPSIMVAPVYEYGARKRKMYFPEGTDWYEMASGNYVSGGQTVMVDAPYERIPLYAKAGSIIPVGPEIQYSDEKQPEITTLFVYAGDDGEFMLYEDEGINYNYEKGKFATICFRYDDTASELTIGNRTGSFDGMLENRIFNIIKVDRRNRMAFNPDFKGKKVKYNGNEQKISL